MISGSTSLGCKWGRKPPDMAANILGKKLLIAAKRWSPGLGMGLTSHHKKSACYVGIHTKFWAENLNGRDYLEDLGMDGREILKWILKKCDVRVGTGFIWLRMWTVTCFCEHCNELSDSMRGIS
jgi:hypothetical protein